MSFESADGLVWVTVRVPGQDQSLNFVLDSGAGSTVVDLKTARKLGLKFGKPVSVRGMQGQTRSWWLKGFSARICGEALPTAPLALDLEPISRLCHRQIDGLIGADFLSRQVVQLDPSTRTLRIGSACEPAGAGAMVLKVKRNGDAWCAAARINGSTRLWFRIDTGHDGGLAWCPGNADDSQADATSTIGFTKAGQGDLTATLDFGSFQTDNIKTSVLPRAPFLGQAGLLGNAFLSRYRVTFNLARNRLILEPLK